MDKHKGWGPWKQVWLSGCSAHQTPEVTCGLCRKGRWASCWGMAFNQMAFAISPRLWRAWANRGGGRND